MTNIAIIGTGYVGLTTGACFSHLGHKVVCADVDQSKIDRLNNGEIPIVETGLDEMVKAGLSRGSLQFVVGAENAVKDCAVAFLCVPTPQDEDGSADLSYIKAAAAQIGPHLPSGAIVVNKSTVPVGSADLVAEVINRPDDVFVVSNPEFLREGSAVNDFLSPDRVVVGSNSREAAQMVAGLYSRTQVRNIIVTDSRSSEMIKYASNAFLATKLSFINAIAAICEGADANVDDVALGMGLDRRIGPEFLRSGPGWGGSCFPKDSRALVSIAKNFGYDFDMLTSVIETNEQQFAHMAKKIERAAGGQLAGKTVAVWGLTFKSNTDDLRDSPSISIIKRLVLMGANVRIYDPTVGDRRYGVPQDVTVCSSAEGAAAGASVVAVLTEWQEFQQIDPRDIATVVENKAVVDGRNILDENKWTSVGFTFSAVGRK